MNVINVIRPYKWSGIWVFDDELVGLDKEAFVAGADTMIDMALAKKGIQNGEDGFVMIFSASPFPGADYQLEWQREETGGNIYLWREAGQEGWLCPALLRYFDSPPQQIYVQLRAAE